MSIIVVEGVDASGKSTLLENARIAIKRRYFLLLRHSCRPLSHEDVYSCLRTMEPFSRGNHGDLVVDRHPLISEPIYGPILRGSDITDFYSDSTKEQYLLDTVGRIIYCRPPLAVIKEHLAKNPQLAGVAEKIEELVAAYDQRIKVLAQSGLLVLTYDWKASPDGRLEDLFFNPTGGDWT